MSEADNKKTMEYEKNFICPITQERMIDPVIAADGISYERTAIQKWLTDNDTSPKTNLDLEHKELISNITLKAMIDEMSTSSKLDDTCYDQTDRKAAQEAIDAYKKKLKEQVEWTNEHSPHPVDEDELTEDEERAIGKRGVAVAYMNRNMEQQAELARLNQEGWALYKQRMKWIINGDKRERQYDPLNRKQIKSLIAIGKLIKIHYMENVHKHFGGAKLCLDEESLPGLYRLKGSGVTENGGDGKTRLYTNVGNHYYWAWSDLCFQLDGKFACYYEELPLALHHSVCKEEFDDKEDPKNLWRKYDPDGNVNDGSNPHEYANTGRSSRRVQPEYMRDRERAEASDSDDDHDDHHYYWRCFTDVGLRDTIVPTTYTIRTKSRRKILEYFDELSKPGKEYLEEVVLRHRAERLTAASGHNVVLPLRP